MRVPLRVTVTLDYDADPKHYGTEVPGEMAAIDQENWRDDPMALWASFEDGEFTIVVESKAAA